MRNIIMVQNLEQGQAAVAQTEDVSLTIQNVEGSHYYLGFPYIYEMFKALISQFPDKDFRVIYDAADDAPATMVALRSGIPTVRYTGEVPVRQKLQAMAQRYGACVVA